VPGLGQHLVVDHHHGSGKVRGLLCHHCDVAIGYLREDTTLFDKAKTHLLQFQAILLDEVDNIEKR